MNVSCQQLSYRYPDGTGAIADLNLSLHSGERVALVGANGSGKSTLLLLLTGLLAPGQGEVRLADQPLTPRSHRALQSRLGLVFQTPADQLFMPTLLEDVMAGPLAHGRSPESARQQAVAALERVGLDAGRHGPRFPGHLSGGEQQRGAIAGLLAMEAELLLLDEPTAHLDPRTRRELLTLLQTLPQTLIVATHDLDFALDLCPRTLVLSAGQLVADGPTEAIFERDDDLRAWGLEPPLSWRWRPQPPSTFPRKTM